MPLKTLDDLQKAIRLRGVSQAEVATHAGIAQSTLSRILDGSTKPRPSTLQRLVEVIDEIGATTTHQVGAKDPETIRRLVKDYESYARNVLNPNRAEIKKLFARWHDPIYWARHTSASRLPTPSPVQRAVSRIKRPESVVDKILRKPGSFPDGLVMKSVEAMQDTLGGRVIVYFLSNLPLVDQELRESEVLEVSPLDPPIAYLSQELADQLGLTRLRVARKDSGYASLHYVVRFRSAVLPTVKRPWFELQVRTLAEDVWGEIEHVLGYKPDKRTSFAVKRQFRIIASELTAIDEHFNLLYQELSRFQKEAVFRDADPLNAENLPPVLNELGIGCAQSEIDGQLKLLASRGFHSIGDLREGAAGNRLEMIKRVYHDYRLRTPSDFEVVAGIAALKGVEGSSDIADAIKSQIDILEAWVDLKKEIKREDANDQVNRSDRNDPTRFSSGGVPS